MGKCKCAGLYKYEDGSKIRFNYVWVHDEKHPDEEARRVPLAVFEYGGIKVHQGQWDLEPLVALVKGPGWRQVKALDPAFLEQRQVELLAVRLDGETEQEHLGSHDYDAPWSPEWEGRA